MRQITTHFTLRLNPRLHEQLADYARARGISQNELAQELLADGLQRLGLICTDAVPTRSIAVIELRHQLSRLHQAMQDTEALQVTMAKHLHASGGFVPHSKAQ